MDIYLRPENESAAKIVVLIEGNILKRRMRTVSKSKSQRLIGLYFCSNWVDLDRCDRVAIERDKIPVFEKQEKHGIRLHSTQ